MAQNVTIAGASYEDVPSVDMPTTGGGTSSFFDVSDTTATAADVASGKVFYAANGVQTVGTASAGPEPSSTTPLMDGTAAVGTATTYARADHVHPTDTSRVAASVTNANGLTGTIANTGSVKLESVTAAGKTSTVLASGIGSRLTSTDESSENYAIVEARTTYAKMEAEGTSGTSSVTVEPSGVSIDKLVTPTTNTMPTTKQYVDDGLAAKQATLVSGTNIKTINGESVLGNGDIAISGGADFKLVPVFVRSTSNTRATVAIPDVGPDDVVVVFSSFANNDTSHFGNFAAYRPYVEKNVNGNVTFKFAANISGNGIGMLVAVISSMELQVFGMDSATVSNRKPSVGETITVTGDGGATGTYSLGYVDTVTGETVTYANLSDVSTYTGSFAMPSHSVYLISSYSGGGNN